MAAGVDGEAPRRARQLLVALEVRLDHLRMRQRRMQVDRHAELFRPLPDRPVLARVEKLALLVAMDHRAPEAELADAAPELFGSRLGIRRWQGREAGKSIRVFLYCLRKP